MTIVNTWLSPGRAVMLADTLIVDRRSAPVGFASKFAVIPHLNAIVAVRGDLWHLEKWESWWRESRTVGEALNGAAHCAREIVRAFHELKPDGVNAEFISLVWEPLAGRVVGMINIPERNHDTICLADGTHAFPYIPGYPTPEAVPLADVAREQFRHADLQGVPADAGGDWTEATITADGVTARVLAPMTEQWARKCRGLSPSHTVSA